MKPAVEFNDLKNRAMKLEQTIQKLQADLHNAYREYQRLSDEAYKFAAQNMKNACIAQAVALAKAGAPPEQFERILGEIPLSPAFVDDILEDIHET
jgi:hypothetical protein